MGTPVNLGYFEAAGREVQKYFLDHILVGNMLVQILVVAVLYGVARLAAGVVRPWLRRFLGRHPWIEHSLPHLIRVIVARLVGPLIMMVLLWVAYGVAAVFHWPNHGIRIALGLLVAWVIIRLATSQMKNRTLARIFTVIMWSIAALDIVHLLVPFLTLLDRIDLSVSTVHLTALSMAQAALICIVLFWLARKISVLFEHWIKSVEHFTPSAQVLLYKLVTFSLFTAVVLGVLAYLGISLTAFAVFSGAIGLGIGVGLQKICANLICGLIILADKSIKPGDVIQMGETYGRINFLGSRYISVVTRDATEHLIPNEDLVTNQVVNCSYSNSLLRLKIPVGISYDSPLPRAMELMLEAARATPRVLDDPAPVCLLMGFGESSVDFQLRVWIQDPQNGVHNVRSQILMGVWERFQEHGIDLPFPQRVVHHKSLPEVEVALRSRDGAAGMEPAK
jgi:small-conductance mechanosensitive channel